MRRWVGPLPLLAVAFATAACRFPGYDVDAAEGAALDASEAAALAAFLLAGSLRNSIYSGIAIVFSHAHGPEGLHTHPVEGPYTHALGTAGGPLLSHHNLVNIDTTFASVCPLGGNVAVEIGVVGEGNPRNGPGAVVFAMTQTHEDCWVDAGSGGIELILNGAPYITGEVAVSNDDQGSASMSGAFEGSLRWQSETATGTCDLSVEFSASGHDVASIASVALAGSVCGASVDETVPTGSSGGSS